MGFWVVDQNLFLQQLYMSLTHNALPHISCYWYHKGKTFQANHNSRKQHHHWHQVVIDTTKVRLFKQITTGIGGLRKTPIVVIDTTKVRLFKQITTRIRLMLRLVSCYWYHKGKTFQANHNLFLNIQILSFVVIDTTKVRLFKQITTVWKSSTLIGCCYWYHKGKTFQANHNTGKDLILGSFVVIDTTKVRLFKQITTSCRRWLYEWRLLLIPQR